MKIKAIGSIIEFDNGAMVVLNPGDEGELSEAIALQKIGAGLAEEVKAKKKGKASEPVEPAPEPAPEDTPPADDSEDGAPV